jgi:hypothetical protein
MPCEQSMQKSGPSHGSGRGGNMRSTRSHVMTRRAAHMPSPSPSDVEYEPSAKRQRQHGSGGGASGHMSGGSGGGADPHMYGLRSGTSAGGYSEGYPDEDAAAIANANFGRPAIPHDLGPMDYAPIEGSLMGAYGHHMDSMYGAHYGRPFAAGSSGGMDLAVGAPEMPAAGSRPGSGGGKMPVTVNPAHVAVTGQMPYGMDPMGGAGYVAGPPGATYAIQYAQPKGPATATFLITQPGTALPISTGGQVPVHYYTPADDDSAGYNTTTFVYEPRAPRSSDQQTASTTPPQNGAAGAMGAGVDMPGRPSPAKGSSADGGCSACLVRVLAAAVLSAKTAWCCIAHD